MGRGPIVRNYSCVVCSGEIVMRGRGRPPSYCSPHCRYVANLSRNGDTIRKSVRGWAAANGPAYNRAERRQKPEQVRARERRKYERHRDAILKANAARKAANLDRYRVYAVQYAARRRSWVRGNDSAAFTRRDWERLLHRQRFECFYCHIGMQKAQIEHVIPLSRGGRHAVGNIVAACEGCNFAKRNRLVIEWRYGKRPGTTGRRLPGTVLPSLKGAGGRERGQAQAVAETTAD